MDILPNYGLMTLVTLVTLCCYLKKAARWRSFFSGSVDIILLVGGGLFAEEGSGVFAGSVEGGEFFYYSGTVGCVGYAEPA